ncbi:MAG: hypothetical protein GY737_02210 [Desulfobacteraceae bacterium]|nr:hypothetical protein [Desulfobacteraceae bacterium]
MKEVADACPHLETLSIRFLSHRGVREDSSYSTLVDKCSRLTFVDVLCISTNESPSDFQPPAPILWPMDRAPVKIVRRPRSDRKDSFGLCPSRRIGGGNVKVLEMEEEKAAAKEEVLKPWLCQFTNRCYTWR